MMGQIAEFASEPVALWIGGSALLYLAIFIRKAAPEIWKLE
jgi:hypothetical protein